MVQSTVSKEVENLSGLKVHITGVVQGVGFRPFVYGIASELGLKGWVRNTAAGVDIEVDGTSEAHDRFMDRLEHKPPPLARIDTIHREQIAVSGYRRFEIVGSDDDEAGFQPVSPDVCICSDCLEELRDPQDRRYRYPFINCTHCGPRFTIIKDIPYDRPATTMAEFNLCTACQAEYEDPLDRRFHAQPVACPDCGPQIWLEPGGERREEALVASRELLKQGGILAIKGLGGFHLAVDATAEAAVGELRAHKDRAEKPFALMMPDLEAVQNYCEFDSSEAAFLTSRERPIVLLKRRPDSGIASGVAPGQSTLGVMLPYTPLHHLLLEPDSDFPDALVMTSANHRDEPMIHTNQHARKRLLDLVDSLLLHDRDIYVRCDDSVLRVFHGGSVGGDPYPIRRARGFAPFPVHLPWPMQPILAGGGELKNTFCLSQEHYAFMSQHIGDLENFETFEAFEAATRHFEALFRARPQALAYDLHPDYLATRALISRAEDEGLPGLGIQHHHAHIAACMAEQGLPPDRPVIGVALDGTGYGTDGTIWGGEFLIADYIGFLRAFHLLPVPLPGGEAAVRQPWRMALSWLKAANVNWDDAIPCVGHAGPDSLSGLERQIEVGLNAPLTSSMGRLFDAAASVIGLRQTVSYEAQAAIELEACADPAESGSYEFELRNGKIDPTELFHALAGDVLGGTSIPVASARFHNSIARMVLAACQAIRSQEAIQDVVLSGGVWQNMTLLNKSMALLEAQDFNVFIHREVPANDGGLALGQIAIAYHSLN